jgi:hypothetical protein
MAVYLGKLRAIREHEMEFEEFKECFAVLCSAFDVH